MTPPTMTPTQAVALRGRLGGVVTLGGIVTLLAYAVLLAFADLTYPFGIAMACGLLVTALRFGAYRAHGIVADETGLRDLASGTSIPWPAVTELRFELVPVGDVKLRVANVAGGGKTITFGDLEGRQVAGRTVVDVAEPGLLLAVIADRTGSIDVFPSAWKKGPAQPPAEFVETPAVMAAPKARGRLEGAGLLALLFKLGPKLGKILLALVKTIKPGAALITIAAYSLIFSWQFAIALVAMVLVHECGHVYAMWRSGVSVKGIYFVPFFGGLAMAEGQAASRKESAYIAINGPVWGAAFALACAGAYFASGSSWTFIGVMAAWGALLNLFNLLPILPLDGGRILSNIAQSAAGAIGTLMILGSLLLGGILAYFAQLELLVLMVLLGSFEFGSHLMGVTVRRTGQLLRRELGTDEYEHFTALVTPVQKGQAAEQRRQRRAGRFSAAQQEAAQRPMNRQTTLLSVGGYVALTALLLSLLFLMSDLPGGGAPLRLLE